ncbi:hypothetical protein Bpfe_006243 [Biomphalaria pfeifferi]|uniref:Ig-like domain-containing protein n=1 Tax=Biomphalaria pfeifferi TaxID=112525 RepID=A0AAD8C383_BIOPF|nr:hypothetical protein Bpfe_006243 [Biomphalaria pfeifferi]
MHWLIVIGALTFNLVTSQFYVGHMTFTQWTDMDNDDILIHLLCKYTWTDMDNDDILIHLLCQYTLAYSDDSRYATPPYIIAIQNAKKVSIAEVEDSDNVRFDTELEGDWMANGKAEPPDTEAYLHLFKSNVSKKDAGLYICESRYLRNGNDEFFPDQKAVLQFSSTEDSGSDVQVDYGGEVDEGNVPNCQSGCTCNPEYADPIC